MNCNCCQNTTTKQLISTTNSIYTYCTKCKNNYDLVNKHMIIDAILNQLINNLKTIDCETLKIELCQENVFINLFINNNKVFKIASKYNFNKEDINHIKNIILELVEDYYIFDVEKVDIIVKINNMLY